MKLHMLLTPEIKSVIPPTCKIIMDFGRLQVAFPNDPNSLSLHVSDEEIMEGLYCVVEDTTENIAAWLKPFDGVPIGNGNPMLEKFSIMHVK